MSASVQENHNPASLGFFTSPQKPPFSMMKPGPLNSELDKNYEDGRLIPFFQNNVDKNRFPEVWESIESAHEFQRRKARGLANGEAESYRLVKAPKSQTPTNEPEFCSDAWFRKLSTQRFYERQDRLRNQRVADQWFVEQGIRTAEDVQAKWDKKHADGVSVRLDTPLHSYEDHKNNQKVVGWVTQHNGKDYDVRNFDPETGEITGVDSQVKPDAAFTIVEARGWDDAYRVRTQQNMMHGLPPMQEGDRVTDLLTMRGAAAISDSCSYMALKKGGFTTFLTLTLDEQSRRKLVRKVASRAVEIRYVPGDDNKGYSWGEVYCAGSGVPFCHLSDAGDKNTGFEKAEGPFTPLKWEWETSVQKEVSRFMDAAQKMYQRGWRSGKFEERHYPWGKVACLERNPKGRKIRGARLVGDGGGLAGDMAGSDQAVADFSTFNNVNDLVKKGKDPIVAEGNYCPVQPERLHYCWVAESPKNEAGEDNPHIHVLMRWRVPRFLFREWAFRLEQLWGLGFAHLEKIKDPENAGAYMAKAAGYLTKAEGRSDQGRIRGNRYGISKCARAPGWACVERSELGIMGHLIADVYDYWSHLYGDKFAERKKLNDALDNVRQNKELSPEQKTKKRKSIGEKLEGVRGVLNTLPAKVSKYQIVLKGKYWIEAFTAWAKRDQYYDGCAVLPPKGDGEAWKPEKRPDSLWFKNYQLSMHCRRFKRRWLGMTPALIEKFYEKDPPIEHQDKTGLLSNWFEYEEWGAVT